LREVSFRQIDGLLQIRWGFSRHKSKFQILAERQV
jgi:hypothetical protein